MALAPPIIYGALASARGSGTFPFGGVPFDQLAMGIANGVSAWAIGQQANLALVGVSTGTAGGGAVNPLTTTITVPNNVGAVLGALSAAGMVGPLGMSLAPVVSSGISTAFSSAAQYTGTSAGVGIGADVSKIVVANPATLISMLMSTLSASLGGGGPALFIFATGLGNGIAALLLGGFGVGTVQGTASPSSAVGVTNSVVV